MTDRAELERLSSKELHDRAIQVARRRLDIAFFWRLLRAVPAAEAAAGQIDEAESDVMTFVGHLNDISKSGEGEVADMLRPLFIEYLAEHGD
jgi:hypothetical protein